MKVEALVAVPSGVVTEIGPLEAPDGTRATNSLLLVRVKVASAPLNLTLLTSLKPEPVIVTSVPTHPVEGLNESIVGGGAAPAGGATRPTSSTTTRIEPARFNPCCLVISIQSPTRCHRASPLGRTVYLRSRAHNGVGTKCPSRPRKKFPGGRFPPGARRLSGLRHLKQTQAFTSSTRATNYKSVIRARNVDSWGLGGYLDARVERKGGKW